MIFSVISMYLNFAELKQFLKNLYVIIVYSVDETCTYADLTQHQPPFWCCKRVISA